MIDKNLAAYVKHLHENGYLLQNEVIAAQAIQYNWIVVTVDDAWDMTYDITPLGEIALGIQATEGDGDEYEIPIHVDPMMPVDRIKVGDTLLTNIGTPQTSTPAPDADTATGYVVLEGATPLDNYSVVREENTGDVIVDDIKTRRTAYDIARALDAETATLREQLASVQAENTRLYRELDTFQDRVDDLNQMVDEARQERDSALAKLAECEHAHAEASRQRDAATELYNGKQERIEELKRELEVSREARKILAKQINDAVHYLGLSEDNDENSNKAYNILQGYTGD